MVNNENLLNNSSTSYSHQIFGTENLRAKIPIIRPKIFRKGQVTLFIIIGIIVLLAVAMVFYFREALLPQSEYVPEDLKPIKNYIDLCLEKTAEDAIIQLGSQAGHINIPEQIDSSQAYIELLSGGIKIPYWYYNGINLVPSISYMQDEISGYVSLNIMRCVDFSVFKDDFNIEYPNSSEVETVIADNDVAIKMTLPIIVKDKSNGETTKISYFTTNVPVRLKKVYELGKRIMDSENEYTYFENMTVDWMGMSEDIPFNGIEFTCDDKRWKVSDIRKKLQNIVYYNLPKIRIGNTDYPDFIADEKVYKDLQKYDLEDIYNGNYPKEDSPADVYEYGNYLLDVRSQKTDLRVGFMYDPNWGMDLTARPSNNGFMESIKQEGSDEFLGFMCLNTYHFNYDVVYPIEVMVRDNSAFKGRGYVFKYGFEVMVNHNQADREGFFNPEWIMMGGSFIGACDSLAGEVYDIRAVGLDDYGIANSELKGVNITYDCLRYRCNLGVTKADVGSYRLRTKLPSSCANGFLVAEKEGYLKERMQIGDSTDVDVEMKKIKQMDFRVVSNNYNSLNGNIGEDVEVKTPFSALITLKSLDYPSLSVERKYPFDQDNTERKIPLIMQRGTYNVEILLFDEADGLMSGGYKGNWTLNYDDIASSNTIIFHTASYIPKPMNPQQEQEAARVLEENNVYKQELRPKLI